MIANFTISFSGAMNAVVYGIANSAMRKNYTWGTFFLYLFASPVLVLPLIIKKIFQRTPEKTVLGVNTDETQPLNTLDTF